MWKNRSKERKKISASGSVGGARPCQGRGRGFEFRLALFLFAIGITAFFGKSL